MNAFTKVKHVVDKVMEWACIVILAIMTVLVTWQVFTRYVLNQPSAISETTAQYLFVWMVMFGSALVFGYRGHLDITVLKDKLPPKGYLTVELLSNLTLIFFSLTVLVRGGWVGAIKQMGTRDASLGIPMGLIYMSIPFCGAIMTFYAVYNICLAVKEYKEKNQPNVVDDGGKTTV